ncbi:MAG: hypothetical protein RI958_1762 [Actinomycetota bacterium]
MVDAACAAPGSQPTGDDVSVVVPTRDRPDLLRRALASVRAQTVRPAAVIVVEDGGVTAATRAVVVEAGADGRVPVQLLASSGGAAQARNLGLAQVTTRFTAFLDDDDHWRPTFVERTLEVVQGRSAPTAVFTAAVLVVDDRETEWLPCVRDAVGLLTDNGGFAGQNGLFPTDAVRAVGGWDERLVAFQDRDLQVRLAVAGLSFEVWPEPLTVIDKSHHGPRISTTRRAEGSWQFTRTWWSFAPLRRRPAMLVQLALCQESAGSRWRRAIWRFTWTARRGWRRLRGRRWRAASR